MLLQYSFPGALSQLYSLHLMDFQFGPLLIGACCATQALASVFVTLLVGQAADRWFAPERCLAVCSAAAGAVLLLLSFLSDPLAVFVTTLVFWMLANPVMLLGTTISFTHLERPDKDFGSVRLWGTVGWVAPGWLLLVLGLFGAGVGTTELFRLGSLFGFALALYALSIPPTRPRPARGGPAAPLAALTLLRGRTFATLCLCTFGVYVTWPFATQALPILMREIVPTALVSPTLSLQQLIEVLGLAVLPVALRLLGLRCTMLGGLAAWCLALVVLAAGQPAWLVVASLGLNGIVVSWYLVAGQMYLNRQATGDLKTSVQALLTFVSGVGLLVGHLLVGYLRWQADGALPQVFAVGAAIMASMLACFAVGFRESVACEPTVALLPRTSRPRLQPQSVSAGGS
jgi:hypothetical protein